MSVIRRFLNLFRMRKLERDIDNEIQFHLDRRIERNRASGMSQDQATRDAYARFGSVERARTRMLEARMLNRQFVTGVVVGMVMATIASALLWQFRTPVPPRVTGFYYPGEDGVGAPVVIREQKPSYTPAALQAQVSGTVQMTCIVQTDGSCDHIHILGGGLHPDLNKEAVRALELWRFQPAKRAGTPVPTLVTVEMSYNYRE
jgi:TonB family protein